MLLTNLGIVVQTAIEQGLETSAGAVGNSEGTAVRGTLGNWRLDMFCPLAL